MANLLFKPDLNIPSSLNTCDQLDYMSDLSLYGAYFFLKLMQCYIWVNVCVFVCMYVDILSTLKLQFYPMPCNCSECLRGLMQVLSCIKTMIED